MAEELIPAAQEGQGPAPRGGYNAAGPDYRQVQQPAQGIQPYHLHANTGMAAEALARTFREFESGGVNLQDKIDAKLGAQKGAAAGLQPGYQPKTGLDSVTAYGSAYDAAAHVSYVNATRAQIDSAAEQAEQDYAGDPNGYNAHMKEVGEGLLKQVPTLYQPEMTNALALRTQAGFLRLREQAIVTARQDAFASYTDSRDTAIASALQTAAALPHDQQSAVMQQLLKDDSTQRDALVKARAISPERAAVLGEEFKKRTEAAVQKQYVGNTVDHMMEMARGGDVDAADRALKAYISDPKNSDQDKTEITQKYLEEADRFHQVQARVYAPQVDKLAQSMVGDEKHPGAYGRRVEDQIQHFYKIGALSPEQRHSMMDQSMRNQVQSIKDDSSNIAVDAAMHGTGPALDPTKEADKKAVDTYWKTHTEMSGVPTLSDAWTMHAAQVFRNTNIMPASVSSALRVGLISGKADQAVQAAWSGERIRAANPSADVYASDRRSAVIANEIVENMRSGMSGPTAYQAAVAKADRPKDQQEIISKAYGKIARDQPNGNANALRTAVNTMSGTSWFGNPPAVPVALQAEFNRNVQENYALNQDIDKARKLAAQQVQSSGWGVSKMNGAEELVKYPPERLGVTPEMIRSDLESVVKAAGYTGDPKQLRLVSNSATNNSQGRVWSVQHVDSDTGVPDAVLGQNNQPLVYHIPQGPDLQAAQEKIFREKLAAAHAEREKDRKTRIEQIQGEQQMADFYLNTPAGRAAMAH